MFELPIFKKKHSSNKFLVADISTNKISVVAYYYDGNMLKSIGSSTQKIDTNIVTTTHILDKGAIATELKEAAYKATLDLGEDIKDIIIGVKGDNCIELTTTAKATTTTQRIITDRDTQELYRRIIEAAFIQAQNDILQNTGNYDEKLELITSSQVYSKLDNSLVENPLGKEGEILESAVFNAFCSKNYLNDIKDVAKKAGLNLLAVAPIPYALVQCISKTQIEEITDYTLININSDITEVIIVFGKGIVSTKTIPIGYNQIVTGIGYKMGLTVLESEKVLETYAAGELTESESSIVQKCIIDILYTWIEGIKLAFEEFTEIKTFANQIYITGKGTTLSDIITMLKENPWHKTIPFKSLPEVRKLEINELTNIGDATGKINSTIWLPLNALGVIYVELKEAND